MDPNYAVFADDLNRILDEKYECFDVTPVKFTDAEGNPVHWRRVGSVQIADAISFFVRVKDEYREPWWTQAGGTPYVHVPMPPEMFESAAGVAGEAKPFVEEAMDNFYEAHKPKKSDSTRKKTTTKSGEGG